MAGHCPGEVLMELAGGYPRRALRSIPMELPVGLAGVQPGGLLGELEGKTGMHWALTTSHDRYLLPQSGWLAEHEGDGAYV